MHYEAERHALMPTVAKQVWEYIAAVYLKCDIIPSHAEIRQQCNLKDWQLRDALSFLEDFGYILRVGFRRRQTTHLLIMPDVKFCRCCNEPMKVDLQQSILPGRPAFQIATCANYYCALYSVTLSVGEHEKLTDDQIAGYVRARQRRTASAS